MKIDDRARSRRARRFAQQTFFYSSPSLIGYVTRGTKTLRVAPTAQLVSTTKEKDGPRLVRRIVLLGAYRVFLSLPVAVTRRIRS